MEEKIIKKIAGKFSIEEPLQISRLESGLVNVSYKIKSSNGNFVLQELSPIWDERVITDYMAVQQYLRTNGLHVPVLLMANDKPFMKFKGKIWRAFEYQHNDFIEVADKEIAYEAGKMLGKFHDLMNKSNFKPSFTLPGFHDTKSILEKLNYVSKRSNNKDKFEIVKNEIDFLNERLPGFYLPENRQKTVIHGDPKLANFLFKDGKAVSLLDLDTMMEESPLFDLGDALRSWCRVKPATNEYRAEIFESALEGYNKNSPFHFTYQGVNNAMSLITLELASRYLIDFFEEKYFAFKSDKYATRAQQNLTRSKRYMDYQKEFADNFRSLHIDPFFKSNSIG